MCLLVIYESDTPQSVLVLISDSTTVLPHIEQHAVISVFY